MLLMWILMMIFMVLMMLMQSMKFVKDLIVTPPVTCGKDEVGSDVSATVKRNLTKVFDKVVRGQKSVALKKVKIEKE
jgi:hypothetical protein